MEQAAKILRIGLILFYPVVGVLIWFVRIPLLADMAQWNKIGLSVLLFLYGGLRLYRYFRQRPHTEEES